MGLAAFLMAQELEWIRGFPLKENFLSDRVGSRLFRSKYGFQVLYGPDVLGIHDEFVLELPARMLINRFSPRSTCEAMLLQGE